MVLFPGNAMGSGGSIILNKVDVIEITKHDLHHARSTTVPTKTGQVIASLHLFCVALLLHKIIASPDHQVK